MPQKRSWQLLAPAVIALVSLATALTSCALAHPQKQAAQGSNSRAPLVLTSTPVLQDIVQQVAGHNARVETVVPAGADPQNYEPSVRDLAAAQRADIAFMNYQGYEDQRVHRILAERVADRRNLIELAPESIKYAADVIPLLEDQSLDTVWLGLAARAANSPTATAQIAVTEVTGPGEMFGYVTGSFGQPRILFNSADGIDEASDYSTDTAALPVPAHTHMSWAFTKPGIYEVRFRASISDKEGGSARKVGADTLVFAVGVAPQRALSVERDQIITAGHADIVVDADRQQLRLTADEHEHHDAGSSQAATHAHSTEIKLRKAVIEVPGKALHMVPKTPEYRFLSVSGGEQIYQLPQAVLARYRHGEIDPHLLHSVRNARSYVQAVAAQLVRADPQHAHDYRANADRYAARLERLDREIMADIAQLPETQRAFVTTQNRHAYFAAAYGLELVGYMRQSSGGVETSVKEYKKLIQTARNRDVSAVFASTPAPQDIAEARLLAAATGAKVCVLNDQVLPAGVSGYEELLRENTKKIVECLKQ